MFRNNTSLSLIGRTCAIESKRVLDSLDQILVTQYEKRSKKFLRLAVLGVQVAALLIEKRTGGRVWGIGSSISSM
jgi:hypothetical protein